MYKHSCVGCGFKVPSGDVCILCEEKGVVSRRTLRSKWVAATLSAIVFVATVAVAIAWGQFHPPPTYVIPPGQGYDPGLYTPFTHAPCCRPTRQPHPHSIYTPNGR